MSLYYYILLEEGNLAKLTVQPKEDLLDIRNAIYEKHKIYFDDYRIDEFHLKLYKPKDLKIEEDEDEKALNERVKASIVNQQPLKLTSRFWTASGEDSIHSEDDLHNKFIHLVVVPSLPDERGTKRLREDDGGDADGARAAVGGRARRAGGGANDFEEFRAHGYELSPPEERVMIDEKGGTWETLLPTFPTHVRAVNRLSGPSESLIAKKVNSDEIAIFELLNNTHPKSENIISLVDSVHTPSGQWIIMPRLESAYHLCELSPGRIRGKANYISWGLIKGLAHLHRLSIAHRGIQPDNLLLDVNEGYRLKIIDFCEARRMKDENEEVDDILGVETWMAPEVENETSGPYSPIKADRWACGRFILYILDKLQEKDPYLRRAANHLKADDPEERPSLIEWKDWNLSRLYDE